MISLVFLANMSYNVRKTKTLSEVFLEDFETQNEQIPTKAKKFLLKKRSTLLSLYTLDFFLCHILIGPSVVAFWRGTWDYSNIWLDRDLCGGNLTLSNIICLLGGLLITGLIDVFHTSLKEMAGEVGSVKHSVMRHAFSLVWGVADIFLWKGLWDGVDHWFGHGIPQAITTFSLGLLILSITRSMKSALSMPVRC